MPLPKAALFAFNCNLDHLRVASEEDLSAIDSFSPQIRSQIDECFAYGAQKEIAIDSRACGFFLTKLKFDRTLIGGQAGNAAEQASALGVRCFLHSNFANESLCSNFSHPENILLAGDSGFAAAGKFPSQSQSAHHFVFEHPETRTRFIASFDPVPLHIDSAFSSAIVSELPGITHAFIGGLHLLPSANRLQKFAEEIARWKEINPKIRTFCELGEFLKPEVREETRKAIFPLVDVVGLNDTELALLGCELDELFKECNSLLFHTPEHSLVLPREKEDEGALDFAAKCSSFLAASGRHGTLAEIETYEWQFVESPARTVGLGDAFSCAYFLQS